MIGLKLTVPHEDFVQVPDVAQSARMTLGLPGVFRPELPTPLPDGLVGDGDSPVREQFLNVAQTRGEPKVQPDAVTDDLSR